MANVLILSKFEMDALDMEYAPSSRCLKELEDPPLTPEELPTDAPVSHPLSKPSTSANTGMSVLDMGVACDRREGLQTFFHPTELD
ncbi:uncharacterized protein LOC144682446 isoform X2 [Cetorhinus maximus]